MSTDSQRRLDAHAITIEAEFWTGVERIVERIETHAPHMPARVREPWGALDLEGLARGLLSDGSRS